MKKHLLTSFYLEALLLVVVFVAMILVLTGIFGVARSQSVEAGQLTQAVTLAANAAEAVSVSDSLDETAALLDEGGNVRVSGGRIEADYLSDGSPCVDGKADLRLTVSWEPSAESGDLVSGSISVFAADGQTAIYTLETARYRKGASS